MRPYLTNHKALRKLLNHGKYTESRLLPCPFCGGKPRLLPQKYGYSVDCQGLDCGGGGCGAMMRIVTRYLQQVKFCWNSRSENAKTKTKAA